MSVSDLQQRTETTYTLNVSENHLLDELVERDLPLPAKNALGLCGGSVEELNLGRTLLKVDVG